MIIKFLDTKGEILLTGIILFLSLIPISQAHKREVKVKAEIANIHLWPDVKSQVIARVYSGAILDSEDKKREWHRIYLPPDKRGIIKSGYIHKSLIEDTKEIKKFKMMTIAGEKPKYEGEILTLKFKDADIRDVIVYLSTIGRLNVAFDPDVSGKVTCKLKDVPWDLALDIILKSNRLGKTLEGNVLRVARIERLIK